MVRIFFFVQVYVAIIVSAEQEEKASCEWPPKICHGETPQSWRSIVRLIDEDRGNILERLGSIAHAANVATSVCAKLEIAGPCELLTKRRGGDLPLACNYTTNSWDLYARFFYTPLVDEMSSLHYTPVSGKSPAMSSRPAQGRASTFSPLHHPPLSLNSLVHGENDNELQSIHTKKAPMISKGYLAARRFATQGRPFIWTIQPQYRLWKWPLQTWFDSRGHEEARIAVTAGGHRKARKRNSTRCEYVSFAPSLLVTKAVDTVLAKVIPQSTTPTSHRRRPFGTLHVRQNDDTRSKQEKPEAVCTPANDLLRIARYAVCSVLPAEILVSKAVMLGGSDKVSDIDIALAKRSKPTPRIAVLLVSADDYTAYLKDTYQNQAEIQTTVLLRGLRGFAALRDPEIQKSASLIPQVFAIDVELSRTLSTFGFVGDEHLFASAVNLLSRRSNWRLSYSPDHCPSCDRKEQGSQISVALARLTALAWPWAWEENSLIPESNKPLSSSSTVSSASFKSLATINSTIKNSKPSVKLRAVFNVDNSSRNETPLSTRLEQKSTTHTLRILSWLRKSPSSYSFHALCEVPPQFRIFAATYGAAFADSARSRRECVAKGKLPCDLVTEISERRPGLRRRHCGPGLPELELIGLDAPVEVFEAVDAYYFPSPYIGVSSLASRDKFDPDSTLLPSKKRHVPWIMTNVIHSPQDFPSAFDPSFLRRFDLTLGPTEAFDINAFSAHGTKWPFSTTFHTQYDESFFWGPQRTQLAFSAFFYDVDTDTNGTTSLADDEVNRCKTPSDREKYLVQLDQEIKLLSNKSIDHYGPCPAVTNGQNLQQENITKELFEVLDPIEENAVRLHGGISHFFALIFEKAIYSDSWVNVAPLYDALEAGAVPVYRGSPNITRFLPNSSAVIIISPEEIDPRFLAAKLLRIVDSKERYLQYHAWRQYPFSPAFYRTIASFLPPGDGPNDHDDAALLCALVSAAYDNAHTVNFTSLSSR